MHTPSTFHTLPLVLPSVPLLLRGSAQVEPANARIEYAFQGALEQFGTN